MSGVLLLACESDIVLNLYRMYTLKPLALLNQARAWFFKIAFVCKLVCVCVCVCVCIVLKLAI